MFDYVRTHRMKHDLAEDRLAELERLIADQGSVAVSSLAERLRVSAMTVRRDLAKLAARGRVARVHGGAVADGRLRFAARLARRAPAKTAAAAKLRGLVPERGAIWLDGSTTIYRLAELLGDAGPLIAATSNIDTFLVLAAHPGITPVLVGGALNRTTDNLVGPYARRCLEGMAFAAAFCSAWGLHAELGPSEPEPEDAELKNLVCARSAAVHLAIDHDKLGRSAAGVWTPPAGATLATDLSAADPALRPYRTRFASII
jgi:DeoR family fructose operon transcriptional repressor